MTRPESHPEPAPRRPGTKTGRDPHDEFGDRGAGVVEWLGVSALSIALLVAVFSMLEQVGLDMVVWIRQQLGVG